MIELLAEFVGDGWVYVYNTPECKYEVVFDNLLAFPDTGKISLDSLTIWIIRGDGDKPDELFVYDSLTKVTYRQMVDDGTKGAICVPYDQIT